jgi:hypothetical protein
VPAVLTALVLLHGVVTRGPTTPVCQVGKPCSEPAVGVVLVFSRNGSVVARVRSGTGGRYSISLRPGSYAVRTAVQSRIGSGMKPASILLRRVRTERVDFAIDTGIR